MTGVTQRDTCHVSGVRRVRGGLRGRRAPVRHSEAGVGRGGEDGGHQRQLRLKVLFGENITTIFFTVRHIPVVTLVHCECLFTNKIILLRNSYSIDDRY